MSTSSRTRLGAWRKPSRAAHHRRSNPMPNAKLRPGIASALVMTAAVASASDVSALTGATPVPSGNYAFAVALQIGEGRQARGCTGVLIDPEWVLTALQCFETPGQALAAGPPALPTTATVGKADLRAAGGQTVAVTALVPHPTRDVVLARLSTRVTGVAPAAVTTTPPRAGESLVLLGYGRTSSAWVPRVLHAASTSVSAIATDTLNVDPTSTCKGDAGGPAVRQIGVNLEIMALHHSSWQGGCYGESGSRLGTVETRLDGLEPWITAARQGPGAAPRTGTWRGGSFAVGVGTFDGEFGATLSAGDFNHDGIKDLVIGAPGHPVNGQDAAGEVHVVFGHGDGPSATGSQVWHQDSPDVVGGAESGDRFGDSAAPGDFNGDGFDDLAIGVPGEDDGAGAVNVIAGGPDGLQSSGNLRFSQGASGLAGSAEAGDRFGASLAAGDFNRDGRSDLVVGVPGEDDGAGTIHVLYGTQSGLSGSGSSRWQQGANGIAGSAEPGDAFGTSIAVGDFNNDGFADVAVGAPGEDDGAGAVSVLYGGRSGLGASNSARWSQGTGGLAGLPEENDNFGAALATGDFDGDGFDDLAVGVPRDYQGVGGVHVLQGGPQGLSAGGNHRWLQGEEGVVGGSELGDDFGASVSAGDTNGDGFDDLLVGAPGEDDGAGAVTRLLGSSSGLRGTSSTRWSQQDGLLGNPEPAELFGRCVLATDLNADGGAELVASAPRDSTQGRLRAGGVYVLPSGSDGPSTSAAQVWQQGSTPQD